MCNFCFDAGKTASAPEKPEPEKPKVTEGLETRDGWRAQPWGNPADVSLLKDDASGNQYLAELTRILDHKVQLLRNIEVLSSEHVKAGIALHLPLIEAICRRDAEGAEAILLEHLKKNGYRADFFPQL